jgi:hypothetical protein
MWKPSASILGCCLAALPVIGCAGSVTALPPQAGLPPAAVAATIPEQGVYATRGTAPAAVLLFLPAAVDLRDVVTRDPALWAAQGFDIVMPRPSWDTRLIVEQEAAIERLLASAQALADAPIWLVGPGPEIEAAMPQLGPGQVSSVVVTSVTSNAGSCSRTMYYSNLGNEAEPKVVVNIAGDACGASPPFGGRRAPSSMVPVPHVHPNAPRIIETSIPADRTGQQPFVQRLAEEIKAPPSS